MKKLLIIIFLFFLNSSSFAETLTLSRCFTLADTQPERFSGLWAEVWGIENSFDKDVFKKNQYAFDTNKNELIHNYRFTEDFHNILTGLNEYQKKNLMKRIKRNLNFSKFL